MASVLQEGDAIVVVVSGTTADQVLPDPGTTPSTPSSIAPTSPPDLTESDLLALNGRRGNFHSMDQATGRVLVHFPSTGQTIPLQRHNVMSLRDAIKAIQQSDLDQKAKAQRMHALLNPSKAAAAEEPLPGAAGSQLSATMAPPCSHYDCRCVIIPKCCPQRPFKCRLCHDETIHDHKIDRFATELVICEACDTMQPVSNTCSSCGITFGEYFCSICKLWKKDDDKGTFHCSECGICRVGKREDYIHCHTCSMCVPSESHRCISGKYKAPCPVCQADMFSSREPTISMRCGHVIHSTCFHQLLDSMNPYCPLCKKSTVNLSSHWDQLEALIQIQPMPPELRRNVSVLCNDCERYSVDVPFHFLGVKCIGCGSFNTSEVNNVPPNSRVAQPGQAEEAELQEDMEHLDFEVDDEEDSADEQQSG